jgi:hypothetical protein
VSHDQRRFILGNVSAGAHEPAVCGQFLSIYLDVTGGFISGVLDEHPQVDGIGTVACQKANHGLYAMSTALVYWNDAETSAIGKLVEVEWQIISRNLVISTDYTALQEAPDVFDYSTKKAAMTINASTTQSLIMCAVPLSSIRVRGGRMAN